MQKPSRPTGKQVKRFLIHALIIILGNAITAFSVSFFIKPNSFVMGGTTGIGLFVENLLPASVSDVWRKWAVNITVYAANILLFAIGTVLLGKKFAVSTIAGTLLYPTFMSLFDLLNEVFVKAHGGNLGVTGELGSPLLAMIFGGILFGLGVGLVVRIGASTGGSDIPPLIYHKLFNLPIYVGIWLTDFGIVALQAFVNPIEKVLYGVLITVISSFVTDHVAVLGLKRTQVKIVSKKYREIREMILKKISRGVTVLYGQTGYLKEDCRMLLTVISSRQLVTLKNEVLRIDPNAFMTISTVSEVSGRGFSTERYDKGVVLAEVPDAEIELTAGDIADMVPEKTPETDTKPQDMTDRPAS